MLERYEPNVRVVFVRNPQYFVFGLPYADGFEMTIDRDPASRFASWMSSATTSSADEFSGRVAARRAARR